MSKKMEKKYQIKGLKTFRGHDGNGFNCNLYKDNKKVCEVVDTASGGPLDFHWVDYKADKVNGQGYAWSDKLHTYLMTPEEKIYTEICVKIERSPESFVYKLVDKFDNERWLKRQLKTKTLYKLPSCSKGQFMELKSVYDDKVKKYLDNKHPEYKLIQTVEDVEAM